MYVLKVENTRGEIFTLSQNEANYQIIKIEGLNPPNATINSAGVAGMDGSQFNSSKLEDRNIVLTVKINGEVEANRLRLYRYFRTKQWCKLYYKNGSRDVYIEGYVETIECDLFEIGETMQISIICNDPYFKAMEELVTDISLVLGHFVFPFAFGGNGVISGTSTDDAIEFSTIEHSRITNVFNSGEGESGLIIEIVASATLKNPMIYNVETGEFFGVKVTMARGDTLIINTNKGSKGVSLTSDGTTTNLINRIERGSTWFQLDLGDNEFTYEADTGAEFAIIRFRQIVKYEGV